MEKDLIARIAISQKITLIEAIRLIKRCVYETKKKNKSAQKPTVMFLGRFYPELIQIYGYEKDKRSNPYFINGFFIGTPKGRQLLGTRILADTNKIVACQKSTFTYGGTGLNILISTMYLLSRYKNACSVLVPRKRLFRRKPFTPRWVDIPTKVYDISKKISQITWTYERPQRAVIDNPRVLKINKDYPKGFRECLAKSHVRFIFSFIFIDYFHSNNTSAHINTLIYDKKYGYLYIFDPHGMTHHRYTDMYASIFSYFSEMFGIRNTFLPSITCPYKIQVSGFKLQGDPLGFCAAWSTFGIEQILKFGGEFDIGSILRYSNMNRNYIRDYAEFLMEERRRIIGDYSESDFEDPDVKREVEGRLRKEVKKYT